MDVPTRTVSFYMNDGTDTSKKLACNKNQPIGVLPEVSRDGFMFIGWFTNPKSGYGTKFTKDTSIDTDVELYAHWRKSKHNKRRQMMMAMSSKDTWTNEDKGQIHLGLGSDEYDEYLEDLQEHNPLKPNDNMHQELAEHNQDLVLELNEKANQTQNPLVDRKHNESLKRSEILATASYLADSVFKTTDKSDDERLGTMRGNNDIVSSLVNNPSKSIDETVDDTEDYIMYGHKYW